MAGELPVLTVSTSAYADDAELCTGRGDKPSVSQFQWARERATPQPLKIEATVLCSRGGELYDRVGCEFQHPSMKTQYLIVPGVRAGSSLPSMLNSRRGDQQTSRLGRVCHRAARDRCGQSPIFRRLAAAAFSALGNRELTLWARSSGSWRASNGTEPHTR